MSVKVSKQKLRRKVDLLAIDLLTCKPLDSYSQIQKFLEKPPPWRKLCKELRPHSKESVTNMDNLRGSQFSDILVGSVTDYCHFDPDARDPTRDDGKEKETPKTLVCHEMANGYYDDSHIDGTVNYDAYTFCNWAGIDIFCYYSHNLITIPPLGWINVGHAHGVKVIGTILTEWTEGMIFWDKVLESETKYQEFARAVVTIAKILKFDGWLLNIENKISNPDMLLQFLSHLHKLLHSELVDPELIWYDSVTIRGKLNWQNKLNDKNKPFFDVCDGFCVNYSWSVADVESSVMAAGSRVKNLYISIDIWGRNFYSGGQFNTFEAIKIAYNEGCSLAIFAPSWTYEAISSDRADPNWVHKGGHLEKFALCQLRDRALWFSIWPYLHTRLPCHLPFQTSFCRGQGKKRWLHGEVISPGPWYNLRLQQYQPNATLNQHCYKLTMYDQSHKVHTKASKGIIKYTSSAVVEGIQEEPQSSKKRSKLEIKDSFDNIVSTAPSPDESVETKPNVNAIISPVISCQPTEVKPILKKSFIQRFLELFKCFRKKKDQSSPTPIKRADYFGSEKIVSHSTAVGATSMAGTSYLEKSIDKVEDFEAHKEKPSIDKSSKLNKGRFSERSNSLDSLRTADKKSLADESKSLDNTEAEMKEQAKNDMINESTRTSMITTSIYLNLKQPDVKTRWVLSYIARERECLELYLEDAFNGGACLRVNPSDVVNTWHRVTRLFHCDFKCDNMLIVCVVTKTMKHYADQSLNVRLKMQNVHGQDLQVVLLGRNLVQQTILNQDSMGIHYAYPLHREEQKEFQALREYLLLNEPGFYVPIYNFYGWEVRYYKVHVPGSQVIQINCRTELPQGGILLGHLGICHSSQ